MPRTGFKIENVALGLITIIGAGGLALQLLRVWRRTEFRVTEVKIEENIV